MEEEFMHTYQRVTDPQFSLDIVELAKLAGAAQMSWSLNFSDGQNEWDVQLSDPATNWCSAESELLNFPMQEAISFLKSYMKLD